MTDNKKLVYSGYFLNGIKNEYIITRLYLTGEIECEKRPVDPQGLRLEYIKQELRYTNIQAQEDYQLAPLLVKMANHLNKLGEAFERRALLRPNLGYALSTVCEELPTFALNMFTVDKFDTSNAVTSVHIDEQGNITNERIMFRNKDKLANHIIQLKQSGYQMDAKGEITIALKRLADYNNMMQNTLAESIHNFSDMEQGGNYSFKRF